MTQQWRRVNKKGEMSYFSPSFVGQTKKKKNRQTKKKKTGKRKKKKTAKEWGGGCWCEVERNSTEF